MADGTQLSVISDMVVMIHCQQRAIVRPWFAKDRISDLNIFDRHTTTTLDLMLTFAQEGVAFDAQDLFARFTLDSASEFLFGNCLDTLHGKLPVAGYSKMGPKGSSIEDEFGTFAWAFEVSSRYLHIRI